MAVGKVADGTQNTMKLVYFNRISKNIVYFEY
jgi:hypothetical protein